jgi:hypothetical protein
MRRITHHNEQKGSVVCPIPPPRSPPVTLAQWAQLLNVLEVRVSAAMFDETKLTVGQGGHPMALELMVDGDMGEGEEVAHAVEVDKQRAIKGKQRDQGNRALDQQPEREDRLQIIVGSTSDHFLSSASFFQRYRDDQSVPDLDPDFLDGFDIDGNGENADDWDEQIIELSCKGPSKISEVMAIEVKALS